MEMRDVVMKLIGPVRPYGDHNIDSDRRRNLEELIDLTDYLLGEISSVAHFADRPEFSMKALGLRAQEFLNEVRDQ